MRFGVLGPLQVTREDQQPVAVPGAKERLLLAVLASASPTVVGVDRLVDLLWDGEPPPTARKSLQAHVVRLRSTLEPGRPTGSPGRYVVRRGPGYALAVGREDVDASVLADGAARGRALLASGNPAEAERVLSTALGLWRGEPYVDWPEAPFAEAERRRLTEVHAAATESLLETRLALGRSSDLVPELEGLVAEEPLREAWWALLALALYRTGRQGDALDALRRARSTLADALGVDPGPRLRTLGQQILTQDPSLDAPVTVPVRVPEQAVPAESETRAGVSVRTGAGDVGPAPDLPEGAAAEPGTCPYKGLATYETEDAALFHGRARLVSSLVARLVDGSLLVVSGPSGAGKSSVVRAGLLPALVSGALPDSAAWRPFVVTPGRHPVDALADLAGESPPPAPVLFVCDQAEELWRPGGDDAERHAFLDTVLGLLDDGTVTRVVLVIRGDHLGRLAEHAALAERAVGCVVLVPPLTEPEVRAVVVEPAHAVGLTVDPDLVDAIVADVGSEASVLPLLSTALVETWERRRVRSLTLSGYLEAGGVAGALVRSAEDAYASLDDEGRRVAHRLLVRLVDAEDEGPVVRRAVPLGELGLDDDARRTALEGFVRRRLLTVDGERVQVTHEALLTAWPRYARWLEDDATGRAVRRRLAPAALEWDRDGRPEELLYRGARLGAALDWAGRPEADPTPLERAFLEASRDRADAELRAARERAEREAAGRRRTVRLASGLAVVLVLALVAAGLAAAFQQRASERADEAAAASTVADANRLAALSTTVGELDLSLLLAAQAVRLADTPETRDGLLAALVEHRRAVRVSAVGGHVFDSALGDRGRTLYTRTTSVIRAWDVGSAAPRTVFPAVPEAFAVSPVEGLGAALCTSCDDVQLYVFRSSSRGEEDIVEIPQAELGRNPVAVAFDATGRLLVLLQRGDGAGAGGFAVRTVDAANGTVGADRITLPSAFGREPVTGTFSDDGSALVLATEPPSLRAIRVDLDSGRPTPLQTSARPATSVDVLPLPTGTAQTWSDGAVTLYDSQGRVRQVLSAHESPVRDVLVAPDGTWAVTAGDEGAVRLWDVDAATGLWSQPESLTGHTGDVVGADLGPGARTVFTTSVDSTVIAWDVTPAAGFGSAVRGLGDRWIANRPQVVEPGRLLAAPTRPVSRQTVDVMGEATDTQEVAATFVDLRTGRVVDEVVVGDTVESALFGSSVAVSPDGDEVAVTSGFATTVLDTRTREVLGKVALPRVRGGDFGIPGEVPAEIVWGAGWSPDGSRLLLATEGAPFEDGDGGLVVVDPATWQPVRRVDVGGDLQTMETSPDGRLLAVAREDASVVRVLDAETYRRVAAFPLPGGDHAFDMSFSPDGRYLAAGGDHGVLHVVDTRTWEPLHEPAQVHHDLLLQVEWMPDGRTVASSGADGTVSLYDVRRGVLRGVPLPATSDVQEGFTHLLPPTSSELVALSGERPGRRYPMAVSRWLAEACAVAGRDLTRDEWARYVPDRPYQQTCGDLG